jgi:predicted transcriptional regulator
MGGGMRGKERYLIFELDYRNYLSMDLKAEKLELIQWLAQLTDENIIAKIRNLRNEKTDWWDEISEEERSSIQGGLEELERGEGVTHEAIIKKVRDKYK